MGMGHRVLVPSPRDRVALSPALADYEDNCCKYYAQVLRWVCLRVPTVNTGLWVAATLEPVCHAVPRALPTVHPPHSHAPPSLQRVPRTSYFSHLNRCVISSHQGCPWHTPRAEDINIFSHAYFPSPHPLGKASAQGSPLFLLGLFVFLLLSFECSLSGKTLVDS